MNSSRVFARSLLWMVAVVLAGGLCLALPATAAAPATGWRDLFDLHGLPHGVNDRSDNLFFDAGAWHGYSLPPAGDTNTGFVGPFVHSYGQGQWTGLRFAQLTLTDATTRQDITLLTKGGHSAPGYLVRNFSASGLQVRERLIFADSWHAVVAIRFVATRAQRLRVGVRGRLMSGQGEGLARTADAVVHHLGDSGQRVITRLWQDGQSVGQPQLTRVGYRLDLAASLQLKARQPVTLYVVQTLLQTPDAQAAALDLASAWDANRRRWAGYLQVVANSHAAGVPDRLAQRVAAKAVVTLIDNWRAARGDLHHDGVVPSWSNPDFNGFWAWDSWKHAAALAWFAPALAKDQIRAMFDYQAANGMVPDCIFRDRRQNNTRDSKPPLATWAVGQVYAATGDEAFVREMYPHLVRYHRWWYADRDHDGNGLAEYGSTDGTKVAARWESGMDNAVRFDHIRMLKNHAGAWSMDQESADLNAYLYREARGLARMAGVLGKAKAAAHWQAQAQAIGKKVRARMFDTAAGWFFDVRLGSDNKVAVYGADGWIPLWAGVASAAQADAVRDNMLDPNKFNTPMPLPTLARDDPHFAPVKGYWRGPLWLDQALFGVQGLRRYGYEKQADELARRLVMEPRGLIRQAVMHENYDPLTGHGEQSRNFSWTAASYLLLLHDISGHGHGTGLTSP